MSKYRHKRDNFLYSIFKDLDTVGQYDIPVVKATHNDNIKNLLPFNYWKTCPCPKEYYLCFYIDDYQFDRIWNEPLKTLAILKQFKGVIAPDFSLYRDLPTILNIYNCWRNAVLTAFYQRNGINVIPNVSWSDEMSYKWCFDGLPKNSIVAVSSNGCIKNKETRKLFVNGYREMKKRLEPEKVIFIGTIPEELSAEDNIIHFEGYNSLIAMEHKSLTYTKEK